MTAESKNEIAVTNGKASVDANFEELTWGPNEKKKRVRLPKGVRTHIAWLKSTGRLDEAMRFRGVELEKKINKRRVQDEIRFKLDEAGLTVVMSDDPLQVLIGAAKVLYGATANGQIGVDERVAQIKEFLGDVANVDENLANELAGNLPQIRDSMMGTTSRKN